MFLISILLPLSDIVISPFSARRSEEYSGYQLIVKITLSIYEPSFPLSVMLLDTSIPVSFIAGVSILGGTFLVTTSPQTLQV